MDTVRIASVQTRVQTGPGAHDKNVDYAYRALDEASQNGADIICLPETFPGPMRRPLDFDPFEAMSSKARQIGKYVVYGTVEESAKEPGKQYLTEVLLGPTGALVGKYHRTSPPGPWIYSDGPFWDLNYTTDDDLPVFQTELGVIGLLICSEVYVPELCRVLALKGAEIVFLPAGRDKRTLVESWELLIRARAIENSLYTVTCNNMIEGETTGALAMIAGPECELAESRDEGIIYLDADLKRMRWLRQAEDNYDCTFEGVPFHSKPGLLTQWRRPSLWKNLL